jgi:hypothetical protein
LGLAAAGRKLFQPTPSHVRVHHDEISFFIWELQMSYDLNHAPTTTQPLWNRLLQVNLAVAAFVLLANGSALFLGLSGKAPDVLANLLEVVLILAVAAGVVVTAILALIRPEYRQKTLAFHAISLAVGAAALLVWGLGLTAWSTTSTSKVTWSVGWLTVIASYSAYLVSQTILASARDRSIAVKYAYLWIGTIAFAVDIFIYFRLASSIDGF